MLIKDILYLKIIINVHVNKNVVQNINFKMKSVNQNVNVTHQDKKHKVNHVMLEVMKLLMRNVVIQDLNQKNVVNVHYVKLAIKQENRVKQLHVHVVKKELKVKEVQQNVCVVLKIILLIKIVQQNVLHVLMVKQHKEKHVHSNVKNVKIVQKH